MKFTRTISLAIHFYKPVLAVFQWTKAPKSVYIDLDFWRKRDPTQSVWHPYWISSVHARVKTSECGGASVSVTPRCGRMDCVGWLARGVGGHVGFLRFTAGRPQTWSEPQTWTQNSVCVKPNHSDHTDVFGEHTQTNWVLLVHTFSDDQPLIMMISGVSRICGGKGIPSCFPGYLTVLAAALKQTDVWWNSPVMINNRWLSERVRLWRVHRYPAWVQCIRECSHDDSDESLSAS